MSWLKATEEGVVVSVRVVPRASKSACDGILGDALKIRLNAPPVDGKANEALVEFLADALDVPKSRISIVAGETSRNKRVLIRGAELGDLRDLPVK